MARQKTKLCPSCQRIFRARVDAVACSERCRKRLQRAKKTLAQEAEVVKDSATHVLKSLEHKISTELSSGAMEKGFIGDGDSPSSSTAIASPPLPPPPPVSPRPTTAPAAGGAHQAAACSPTPDLSADFAQLCEFGWV